jgi:signal transduction histidine kinase
MRHEVVFSSPMHGLAARVRPGVLLGLMLLLLHAGLVLGLDSGAARALLLAHFGLFLLWQPVWQGSRSLQPRRVLLVVGGGLLFVWWIDWWLAGLWMALLFSLIGANLLTLRERPQRLAPLLAALYLLAVLLVWVVPRLLGDADPPAVLGTTLRDALAVPLLVILLLPGAPMLREPRSALDLFYSFLLFLMTIVLVLGTLFVQQVTRNPYALALAETVLAIAAVLFLLSWLWDPRGGFDGVGQLVSRYFLSLGMPFERWMHGLANLAETEHDPDAFIAAAAAEMRTLPWVAGVQWRTGTGAGADGSLTRHVTHFQFRGLDLQLHGWRQPGPGMLLHMRLLARLLGDFHDAKVREQAQRTSAYLQAIYETGSRVTHDVKNLLQSLRSLCTAAESASDDEAEAFRRLMQRQLPQITQRLQSTLDKLESRPAVADDLEPAQQWWRSLTQRYAHEPIEFSLDDGDAAATLPAELFDSVADNLIQNALEKRRRGEAVRITVTLEPEGAGRCRLSVRDDGHGIPPALAARLLGEPVASDNGLGVGLYQAARYAAGQGYRLRLAGNAPGAVEFVLAPA